MVCFTAIQGKNPRILPSALRANTTHLLADRYTIFFVRLLCMFPCFRQYSCVISSSSNAKNCIPCMTTSTTPHVWAVSPSSCVYGGAQSNTAVQSTNAGPPVPGSLLLHTAEPPSAGKLAGSTLHVARETRESLITGQAHLSHCCH